MVVLVDSAATYEGTHEAAHLHPTQAALLRYIGSYIAEHGYPPSLREMVGVVGTTSLGHVHFLLGRLEQLGYIKRDRHVARSIRIVKSVA